MNNSVHINKKVAQVGAPKKKVMMMNETDEGTKEEKERKDGVTKKIDMINMTGYVAFQQKKTLENSEIHLLSRY